MPNRRIVLGIHDKLLEVKGDAIQLIGRNFEDEIRVGDTFSEICRIESISERQSRYIVEAQVSFRLLAIEWFSRNVESLDSGHSASLIFSAKSEDIKAITRILESTNALFCIRGSGEIDRPSSETISLVEREGFRSPFATSLAEIVATKEPDSKNYLLPRILICIACGISMGIILMDSIPRRTFEISERYSIVINGGADFYKDQSSLIFSMPPIVTVGFVSLCFSVLLGCILFFKGLRSR